MPIFVVSHRVPEVPAKHVSLVPLLLGDSLRLFEYVGPEQRRLEKIKVIDAHGRTDIRYRVVK